MMAMTNRKTRMPKPIRSFGLVRQSAASLKADLSPVLHSGVEQGQTEIDYQIREQHNEDRHRDDPLDRVEVVDLDRLHKQRAQARVVEELLDQHVAVED